MDEAAQQQLDQLIRLYWQPLKIFLLSAFPSLHNQAETLLQDFAQDRMLKEGWLESEAGISAKGRPTRIFRVTEEGIRHLEQEVIQFQRMFTGITRVLAVATA